MPQTATQTSHSEPPSLAEAIQTTVEAGPDPHVRLRGPFPPDQVGDVWPAVEGYVERALEYNPGRLWLEDVRRFCDSGQMLLFVIWSVMEDRILGVVVCEVDEYPRAKVLNVAQCAGDEMNRWIHLLEEIEEVGLQLGCSQVDVIGRSGWSRVLDDLGYKEVCRHLMKEIGHE